ncbi:exosome non-catalytic core subunit rrp40 [Dimargaris cristalligena]|uniref:Ribosomal RNA-processing protein 40 n=1 Tax=Dimargaris cristalligena TaxID=215637 RepID=A0A4P9ZY04_9FUNG|nr:exosome non-catalytic core subunit rrp40 [Dimargaris cristalligena]RKP38566.1 hypothetical protein BJ085DRAFT_34516 [Dimargaris cristalligena]|eukprot:RKP38566.1 hypothetical protein BJ085DRAFT_34516 [Dimargaris cristalligena]
MSPATIVLPGDSAPVTATDPKQVVRLGPGLLQTEAGIQAVQAGYLANNSSGNSWWITGSKKRYVPATGEPVVGTIIARSAEYYKVDIGSAYSALLPILAFEGATKRNRPNLAVGTVVYGRLTIANKDMEPEMECYNSNSGKADGYGELKEGLVVNCSLQLCQRLLNPNTPILSLLGSKMPLDVAIGLNGRIWVFTKEPRLTIFACNAIINSEFMSQAQCQNLVHELFV